MQDEVKVSQADERAVAEFHRQSFETLFATTDADIDAGINRAHTLLCQAFARHRHQAERETLARMDPVYFVPTFQGHDFYRFPPQKTKPDKIHEGWSYVPLYALPPAPEAGQ